MRLRPGLAALASVAINFSAANAATIRQGILYFPVHGATLSEIDRELNRRGPYLSDTGLHHPGATEVNFAGRVSYKRVKQGCAVDEADLSVTIRIMLPKWSQEGRVSKRTVVVWQTLASDIKRHELHHADIAKHWVKRMEMAIKNLQPSRTCEVMEATVDEVSQRYLARHQQAQLEFDAKESQEVASRLRRNLARALSADSHPDR